MSINVAMEGEVRSRSSWEIKPLESSTRAASSSCVRPRLTRLRFIFSPISSILSPPVFAKQTL